MNKKNDTAQIIFNLTGFIASLISIYQFISSINKGFSVPNIEIRFGNNDIGMEIFIRIILFILICATYIFFSSNLLRSISSWLNSFLSGAFFCAIYLIAVKLYLVNLDWTIGDYLIAIGIKYRGDYAFVIMMIMCFFTVFGFVFLLKDLDLNIHSELYDTIGTFLVLISLVVVGLHYSWLLNLIES